MEEAHESSQKPVYSADCVCSPAGVRVGKLGAVRRRRREILGSHAVGSQYRECQNNRHPSRTGRRIQPVHGFAEDSFAGRPRQSDHSSARRGIQGDSRSRDRSLVGSHDRGKSVEVGRIGSGGRLAHIRHGQRSRGQANLGKANDTGAATGEGLGQEEGQVQEGVRNEGQAGCGRRSG